MRSSIHRQRRSAQVWHITSLAATTLFVSASLLCGGELANDAKNLARVDCGVKIERVTTTFGSKRLGEAGASEQESGTLISDDAASYALSAGDTTFILTFPNALSLDRFSFVNQNAAAEGELEIAVSNYRLPAASPRWQAVDGAVTFAHKRLFNLSLVGVEARYVRLSFHVQKGGQIADFGIYGADSLRGFADRNARLFGRGGMTATSAYMTVANKKSSSLEKQLNFNFANLYAKARIAYVSSGTALRSGRMIDDDPATAFRFAPVDRHPTVVIELAQAERLHRVTALVNSGAGRLDVYLLDELKADRGDLSGGRLVASTTALERDSGKNVVSEDADGKTAVSFDPEGARYVAMQWTGSEAGFEVAEIKAFGEVPLSMLNLDLVPESFAMNLSSAASSPQLPPSIPILSP